MRGALGRLFLVLLGIVACGRRVEDGLRGRVVGPQGSVEGAEVLMVRAADQRVVDKAMTNREGKFVLRGRIPPGAYELEVRHPAFVSVSRSLDFPETRTLEIALEPQLIVRGTVWLPEGEVVPQAVIRFSRNGRLVARIIADGGGRYLVPGIEPGTYDVEAESAATPHALRLTGVEIGGEQQEMLLDLVLQPAEAEGVSDAGDPSPSRLMLGGGSSSGD